MLFTEELGFIGITFHIVWNKVSTWRPFKVFWKLQQRKVGVMKTIKDFKWPWDMRAKDEKAYGLNCQGAQKQEHGTDLS